MKNNWLPSTAACILLTYCTMFIGGGCTSYRVIGRAPSNMIHATPLRHTYRLERVKIKYDNVRQMPLTVWNMEYAIGKNPVNDLEERIMRKRRDIFSEKPNDIPIVAEITLKNCESSLGWTIIVPYLISLGILPAQMQMDDICGVSLQRRDTMQWTAESDFQFQHIAMVTACSPIGLWGYDYDPSATVCRSGKGIMQQPAITPSVRENIIDAIAETLTTTIVNQLYAMESQEKTNTARGRKQ